MIPGLTWRDDGQAVLDGPLLALADRVDRAFTHLAAEVGAEEVRFPPLLKAVDLDRVDWFSSFPHLATFAVALDAERDDVRGYALGDEAAPPVGDGSRPVLTPAACYHAYVHLRGAHLDGMRTLTTRNTCYRREDHYVPLERQWAFDMREIVFVGSADEVRDALERARHGAEALLEAAGLERRVVWEHATDPFFQPATNPAHLLQRLQPVKHEAVFDGRLAIGSTNLHHEHFGDAFAIQRSGQPASSACLAFGIQRWLAAIVAVHGPDPRAWPQLETTREPVRCG